MSTRRTKQQTLYLVARNEDLEASGLKPATVRRLRIGKPLPPQETEQLTGVERAIAYEIPYFDVEGKPNGFSRYKLIPLCDDIRIKYWQDEQSISHIYMPPLVDWQRIAQNTDARIVITEGEKKAASACLNKIPCVGVGGVWNFRAKRWLMSELPEFRVILWAGRRVEICYDADLYNNPDVAHALRVLCKLLTDKGARVFVRYLPNTGGKLDLDSFLLAHGSEAYEQLDCHEYDASRDLAELNADLVYVKEIASYYSTRERILYGDLTRLVRRYGSITIPNPNTGKPMPVVREWVRWPHMRMATRLTYEPGETLFVKSALNTWRGWGMGSKRGNVSVMLHIISGFGDPEFQEWFYQWLAYPIQHPGEKLSQGVVIWSRENGTGKTLLGDVMRDIYGDNTEVIKSHHLSDGRYTWLQEKQFIVAEEVTRPGDRDAADRMKDLITGETVRVDQKYVPQFSIPNKANFLFLSNNPDPVYVDKEDRRFAVAKSQNDPHDAKLWREAGQWRAAGGAAHFRYYLERAVDTADFNPKAHAPVTADKRQMIRANMSSLEQWCDDLLTDPSLVLRDSQVRMLLTKGREVFTASDLKASLPDNLDRSSDKAFSNALEKAGAVKVGGGGVVTTREGSRRLVAIKSLEFWKQHVKDHAAWRANYEGRMTVAGRRRKQK